MSVRDGVGWYYRTYGVRGILYITAYRLIGRPKEISAQPPGIPNPVRLRIKTSDEATYAQILLWGQYDFDLPFKPKAIVDAGANVGMASIFFAHKYPGARVIAVEAEASNFELLSRNIAPYRAITAIHAALWNRDGEISVRESDPATGCSGNWAFVTREGPGPKVRAITMRTLMKEMRIGTVDLVKVDIEGAEAEVFEAADWIKDIRCLMIELHDRFRPGCAQAVNTAVQGFSRSQRGETTFYLRR